MKRRLFDGLNKRRFYLVLKIFCRIMGVIGAYIVFRKTRRRNELVMVEFLPAIDS